MYTSITAGRNGIFTLQAVPEKGADHTHQRLDSYFRDEGPEDTIITVRILEQKSMFKVEMTMPYLGHTLRTENQEREISMPALDKGIDIIERQMRKLRTKLGRDLRKKPELVEARKRTSTSSV